MYGVSSSNGQVEYIVRFESDEDAQKWLVTEENDFRTRELLTEDEVLDQYGDWYRDIADDHSHPRDWAGASLADVTPVWPDGVR
ncbi:MAG TPA: hypothetical protein PKJ47_10080 [Candidatus Limiplasma sp.]|nr:hypothetical protein [Candidatus Limiplasma sp.]